MREIKFRFWLGHTKKMTYAHPLSEVGKIVPEFTEDIIPLQYTGLKDKSGKEIYEGDVFGNPFVLRCVVEREEDGAYVLRFLDTKMKGRKLSILDHKVAASAILGNIYQHPHLLTPTT